MGGVTPAIPPTKTKSGNSKRVKTGLREDFIQRVKPAFFALFSMLEHGKSHLGKAFYPLLAGEKKPT